MNTLQQLLAYIGRLFSWWVIVAPWEQIVRVRLGKWVRVKGAGIHLSVPFIDRVYKQSIRRRVIRIRSQTLTTNDGKAFSVSGVLAYRIKDLLMLYNTLHHAQATIEGEVQMLVSQYIESVDSHHCSPLELQNYVNIRLDITRYGLGGVKFFVADFAMLRTYRFITGELGGYNEGDHLITDSYEGKRHDS